MLLWSNLNFLQKPCKVQVEVSFFHGKIKYVIPKNKLSFKEIKPLLVAIYFENNPSADCEKRWGNLRIIETNLNWKFIIKNYII